MLVERARAKIVVPKIAVVANLRDGTRLEHDHVAVLRLGLRH
jgi:hypothetical protein